MTIPRLIAHRGYASRYPENTCLAIGKALEAGAHYVEFDVQMTADHVPVVLHDADLRRTTGAGGLVTDFTAAELAGIRANEPARFGAEFTDISIPTLAAVVTQLGQWPHATAFVEIKSESVATFGVSRVLQAVSAATAPIRGRCVIISYDIPVLRAARARGSGRIGLVLTTFNEAARSETEALHPEFVICNHQKIPPAPAALWPGPWQWALYEIDDPELALQLGTRGADFIETMAVGEMLAHPRLRQGAAIHANEYRSSAYKAGPAL